MRISKTPRSYQEGISKNKHKLSNYVESGLKQIIVSQTNLYLKESHTLQEHVVFVNWLSKFKITFEELNNYDWFKSCENTILKQTKFKN